MTERKNRRIRHNKAVAARARKVKLLKIEKVAPDKHHVHLEVEGAPEPPIIALEEPIVVFHNPDLEEVQHNPELEEAKQAEYVQHENPVVKWFKSLWE
jgi:hypothetical protein